MSHTANFRKYTQCIRKQHSDLNSIFDLFFLLAKRWDEYLYVLFSLTHSGYLTLKVLNEWFLPKNDSILKKTSEVKKIPPFPLSFFLSYLLFFSFPLLPHILILPSPHLLHPYSPTKEFVCALCSWRTHTNTHTHSFTLFSPASHTTAATHYNKLSQLHTRGASPLWRAAPSFLRTRTGLRHHSQRHPLSDLQRTSSACLGKMVHELGALVHKRWRACRGEKSWVETGRRGRKSWEELE